MTKQEALHKLIRFARIYGWSRALNKAVARTRLSWVRYPFVRRQQATISLVGCGQFAFSCICFFLQKNLGNKFLSTYDSDTTQAQSLARYYGFRQVSPSIDELMANPALTTLYIASNHASHTDYAIAGLQRGLTVYVEKPISVTYTQLVALLAAYRSSTGRLFAGYNRPYSSAIRQLREQVQASALSGAFSISYVVNGHQIPSDHWYRLPQEGTRICGNLGHWLDLTIHILNWRGLPNWIDLTVTYSNQEEPDDNLVVTMSTNKQDLVSLMLTSRSEPFEGITEAVNIQYQDIIARIDDFRQLTIWRGTSLKKWRYVPKDVGHQRAVLQPFKSDNRDWREVELSTLLMLHLKEMVLARQTGYRFVIQDELDQLDAQIQQNEAIHTSSI